jgi:hypothetical protein
LQRGRLTLLPESSGLGIHCRACVALGEGGADVGYTECHHGRAKHGLHDLSPTVAAFLGLWLGAEMDLCYPQLNRSLEHFIHAQGMEIRGGSRRYAGDVSLTFGHAFSAYVVRFILLIRNRFGIRTRSFCAIGRRPLPHYGRNAFLLG